MARNRKKIDANLRSKRSSAPHGEFSRRKTLSLSRKVADREAHRRHVSSGLQPCTSHRRRRFSNRGNFSNWIRSHCNLQKFRQEKNSESTHPGDSTTRTSRHIPKPSRAATETFVKVEPSDDGREDFHCQAGTSTKPSVGKSSVIKPEREACSHPTEVGEIEENSLESSVPSGSQRIDTNDLYSSTAEGHENTTSRTRRKKHKLSRRAANSDPIDGHEVFDRQAGALMKPSVTDTRTKRAAHPSDRDCDPAEEVKAEEHSLESSVPTGSQRIETNDLYTSTAGGHEDTTSRTRRKKPKQIRLPTVMKAEPVDDDPQVFHCQAGTLMKPSLTSTPKKPSANLPVIKTERGVPWSPLERDSDLPENSLETPVLTGSVWFSPRLQTNDSVTSTAETKDSNATLQESPVKCRRSWNDCVVVLVENPSFQGNQNPTETTVSSTENSTTVISCNTPDKRVLKEDAKTTIKSEPSQENVSVKISLAVSVAGSLENGLQMTKDTSKRNDVAPNEVSMDRICFTLDSSTGNCTKMGAEEGQRGDPSNLAIDKPFGSGLSSSLGSELVILKGADEDTTSRENTSTEKSLYLSLSRSLENEVRILKGTDEDSRENTTEISLDSSLSCLSDGTKVMDETLRESAAADKQSDVRSSTTMKDGEQLKIEYFREGGIPQENFPEKFSNAPFNCLEKSGNRILTRHLEEGDISGKSLSDCTTAKDPKTLKKSGTSGNSSPDDASAKEARTLKEGTEKSTDLLKCTSVKRPSKLPLSVTLKKCSVELKEGGNEVASESCKSNKPDTEISEKVEDASQGCKLNEPGMKTKEKTKDASEDSQLNSTDVRVSEKMQDASGHYSSMIILYKEDAPACSDSQSVISDKDTDQDTEMIATRPAVIKRRCARIAEANIAEILLNEQHVCRRKAKRTHNKNVASQKENYHSMKVYSKNACSEDDQPHQDDVHTQDEQTIVNPSDSVNTGVSVVEDLEIEAKNAPRRSDDVSGCEELCKQLPTCPEALVTESNDSTGIGIGEGRPTSHSASTSTPTDAHSAIAGHSREVLSSSGNKAVNSGVEIVIPEDTPTVLSPRKATAVENWHNTTNAKQIFDHEQSPCFPTVDAPNAAPPNANNTVIVEDEVYIISDSDDEVAAIENGNCDDSSRKTKKRDCAYPRGVALTRSTGTQTEFAPDSPPPRPASPTQHTSASGDPTASTTNAESCNCAARLIRPLHQKIKRLNGVLIRKNKQRRRSSLLRCALKTHTSEVASMLHVLESQISYNKEIMSNFFQAAMNEKETVEHRVRFSSQDEFTDTTRIELSAACEKDGGSCDHYDVVVEMKPFSKESSSQVVAVRGDPSNVRVFHSREEPHRENSRGNQQTNENADERRSDGSHTEICGSDTAGRGSDRVIVSDEAAAVLKSDAETTSDEVTSDKDSEGRFASKQEKTRHEKKLKRRRILSLSQPQSRGQPDSPAANISVTEPKDSSVVECVGNNEKSNRTASELIRQKSLPVSNSVLTPSAAITKPPSNDKLAEESVVSNVNQKNIDSSVVNLNSSAANVSPQTCMSSAVKRTPPKKLCVRNLSFVLNNLAVADPNVTEEHRNVEVAENVDLDEANQPKENRRMTRRAERAAASPKKRKVSFQLDYDSAEGNHPGSSSSGSSVQVVSRTNFRRKRKTREKSSSHGLEKADSDHRDEEDDQNVDLVESSQPEENSRMTRRSGRAAASPKKRKVTFKLADSDSAEENHPEAMANVAEERCDEDAAGNVDSVEASQPKENRRMTRRSERATGSPKKRKVNFKLVDYDSAEENHPEASSDSSASVQIVSRAHRRKRKTGERSSPLGLSDDHPNLGQRESRASLLPVAIYATDDEADDEDDDDWKGYIKNLIERLSTQNESLCSEIGASGGCSQNMTDEDSPQALARNQDIITYLLIDEPMRVTTTKLHFDFKKLSYNPRTVKKILQQLKKDNNVDAAGKAVLTLSQKMGIPVTQNFCIQLRHYLNAIMSSAPFKLEIHLDVETGDHVLRVVAKEARCAGDRMDCLGGLKVRFQQSDFGTLNVTDSEVRKWEGDLRGHLLLGPISFVNHWCTPNAKVVSLNSRVVGIEAISDILPGEEVTIMEGSDVCCRSKSEAKGC